MFPKVDILAENLKIHQMQFGEREKGTQKGTINATKEGGDRSDVLVLSFGASISAMEQRGLTQQPYNQQSDRTDLHATKIHGLRQLPQINDFQHSTKMQKYGFGETAVMVAAIKTNAAPQVKSQLSFSSISSSLLRTQTLSGLRHLENDNRGEGRNVHQLLQIKRAERTSEYFYKDKTAAARCVPKFSASGMMNLGISGKLVKSNPLDMLKNLQKPQPQGQACKEEPKWLEGVIGSKEDNQIGEQEQTIDYQDVQSADVTQKVLQDSQQVSSRQPIVDKTSNTSNVRDNNHRVSAYYTFQMSKQSKNSQFHNDESTSCSIIHQRELLKNCNKQKNINLNRADGNRCFQTSNSFHNAAEQSPIPKVNVDSQSDATVSLNNNRSNSNSKTNLQAFPTGGQLNSNTNNAKMLFRVTRSIFQQVASSGMTMTTNIETDRSLLAAKTAVIRQQPLVPPKIPILATTSKECNQQSQVKYDYPNQAQQQSSSSPSTFDTNTPLANQTASSGRNNTIKSNQTQQYQSFSSFSQRTTQVLAKNAQVFEECLNAQNERRGYNKQSQQQQQLEGKQQQNQQRFLSLKCQNALDSPNDLGNDDGDIDEQQFRACIAGVNDCEVGDKDEGVKSLNNKASNWDLDSPSKLSSWITVPMVFSGQICVSQGKNNGDIIGKEEQNKGTTSKLRQVLTKATLATQEDKIMNENNNNNKNNITNSNEEYMHMFEQQQAEEEEDFHSLCKVFSNM